MGSYVNFLGSANQSGVFAFPANFNTPDLLGVGAGSNWVYRQNGAATPGIGSNGNSFAIHNRVIDDKLVALLNISAINTTQGPNHYGIGALNASGTGIIARFEQSDISIYSYVNGVATTQLARIVNGLSTVEYPYVLQIEYTKSTGLFVTSSILTFTGKRQMDVIDSRTYAAIPDMRFGMHGYSNGDLTRYISSLLVFAPANENNVAFTETFTGDPDANPYTNAALTPIGSGMRVLNGRLLAISGDGGLKLTTLPVGAGSVKSKITNAALSQGNPGGASLMNDAGQGYLIHANYDRIYIKDITQYGVSEVFVAYWLRDLLVGDTLEIEHSDGVVIGRHNTTVIFVIPTTYTGLKPAISQFNGNGNEGFSAVVMSYSAASAPSSNTANIGSIANVISLSTITTMTSLAIDGVSVPVVSGNYNLPMYLNGVKSPRLGSMAAVAGNGTITENTTITVNPPAAHDVQTIGAVVDTGDFSLYRAFPNGLVTGTVIIYPDDGTGAVNADGTLTNFAVGQHKFYAQFTDGYVYSFWVNILASGAIAPAFTIGEVALEGDVNAAQNVVNATTLGSDGYLVAANYISYNSLPLNPLQNYSTNNATLVSIAAKSNSAYVLMTADTVVWGAGSADVISAGTNLADMQTALTSRLNYFKSRNKRQIILTIPPRTNAGGAALTGPELTKLKAFNAWLLTQKDLVNKVHIVDDYAELVLYGTDTPDTRYFQSDSGMLLRLNADGAIRRGDAIVTQLAADGLTVKSQPSVTTNNVFSNGSLTGTTGTVTAPATGQSAAGTTASGTGGAVARTFSVISSGVRVQFNPTVTPGVVDAKLRMTTSVPKGTGYVDGDRLQAFALVTINSLTNASLPFVRATRAGSPTVVETSNASSGNVSGYAASGLGTILLTSPVWDVVSTDTSVSVEVIGQADVTAAAATMDYVINGMGVFNLSTGQVLDLIPDDDTYPAVTGSEINTYHEISDILVDGATPGQDLSIIVTGGIEYSINTGSGYGAYTNISGGVIRQGQLYRIRMQSLPTLSTAGTPQTRTGTVKIGNAASIPWSITNRQAVPLPGLDFTLKNIEAAGHPVVANGVTATLLVYRTGPVAIDTATATVGSGGVVSFTNNAWTIGGTLNVSLAVPGLATPRFNVTVIDKGQ